MDNQPKTRKELKKDSRQKGQGENGKYSSKHVRIQESIKNGFNRVKQVKG